MALIRSGTIGSEAPYLAYELHAEQVGASGTSRTIKVTGKFKVNGSSSSWYGYACNWRARVHNSYGGWSAIKGTESWNGGQAYRSFSQTLTVDVGTTSSTSITVGLYTDSQGDNGWDGNATGSFTVSSTNTAPYFPSGASITVRSGNNSSGTVLSGIIPENTNTVYISWTGAKDNEGGTLTYALNHSINGGGYSQIDFGTDLAHSYNIGSGNEGQTIQYYVDCRDNGGLWSSKIYSGVLTKNRFTGDTLSSNSSIGYSDGNSSITLNYSGASNTNGNTSFTRVLSCDGVTVYNPTVTGNSTTVTIYRSGTVPTTPYIKFDDIKNKFASSSYKGSLAFTLTTTNAYGTSRTSSKTISVNLQTTPNAVGSCSIATDSNSTAYKTVASTGNKYFIPDGSNVIRVNWTAGSGKLGEAISYELYVAYGTGGWSKVATLNSGTLYYNHVVSKQTESQAIKYKVRTITGYGSYADRDTSAQTLHYYNPPSLTQGTLTRGATTCDAQVTIKSLSSIPNINTVGTWNCYNKGTSTSVSNGSLTVSQSAQTIKVTGLTDAGQYDLKVTFKDDTGFCSNVTVTVAIGANSPLFFVNKYGAGVNGAKADSSYSFKVTGNSHLGNIARSSSMFVAPNIRAEGSGKTVTISQPNEGYAWISTDATKGLYSNQALYVKGDIYAGANFNQKVLVDGGTYDTVRLTNWIRTYGNTGWYNESYAGGWHMTDSTWIRAYNSKGLLLNNNFRMDCGTPDILLNSTNNSAQGLGGRIRFNSADNQNVQLRHEWYDGALQPFGLVVEKASGNTQNFNACLKVEGAILCGANSSAGNIDNSNKPDARIVRGNNDNAGSVKVQVGGTNTTASFEVVNPSWSTAWFSCGNTGIRASSYSNFSDKTLKTNIKRVKTSIMDKVDSIGIYNYNYKSDFEDTMTLDSDTTPVLAENMPTTRWGVIAQEVEELFPELIIEGETIIEGENKVVKSVDVYGLTVLTLEYAKELRGENEKLKRRLEAIEAKLGL